MKKEDAIDILEAMAMEESTFSDEESKKCCEAIDLAVEALKREEAKCDVPLTLAQLRKMLESNRETIGCPIIVSENEILSHAVLDARVDDGICAVVSANEHWLKEKDYGKTWIAYAYHPSRLDIDEWVSVKDDLPEDGEEVIAFAPKQKKTFVGYVIRGKHEYDKPITWFLCGAMRKNYTVTMSVSHWRKKPEEPK